MELAFDPHTGMYSQHQCQGCGKPLDVDGEHPAELYTGTYTGLCYKCQSSQVYEVDQSPMGVVRRMSHPPHCPSWRRDREEFWWWPECTNPDCEHGRTWIYRGDGSGGSYTVQCRTCLEVYRAEPAVQEEDRQWNRSHLARLIWREIGEAEYESRLKKAGIEKEPLESPRPIADRVLSEMPTLSENCDDPLPMFPLGWTAPPKRAKKLMREWDDLAPRKAGE